MSLEHAPKRQKNSGGASFLTAAQVRARYGGVSDMAIWRWLHDPKLAFPQPMRINRRRFWQLADLDGFDQRQREQGAAD